MARKPELLAPAGNFEKLEVAIAYGADAVYLGGDSFGLRAMAGNFNREEICEAVEYAHERGVKVYVTLNVFPHNSHLQDLPEYVCFLRDIGVDSFIVSDPGVFTLAKELAPQIDIHISTQANTMNWAAAEFWRKLGASRIILARELEKSEIKEIHSNTSIDLEAFVHGAMCISYSGRCYLSAYMTGRDANLGACTQPCRWSYTLLEEKRPGAYFPIVGDEDGTYIMNSKDLCLIQYIPDLVETGLSSLKIEGRMKSVHYVATVTKVYRQALDSYYEDPSKYQCKEEWLDELYKVSNREFTTGFFLGDPDEKNADVNYQGYTRLYDFVGMVMEYDIDHKTAIIEQRNHLSEGDIVEVLSPRCEIAQLKVTGMRDMQNQPIIKAQHPQMLFQMYSPIPLSRFDLIRRKSN